MHKKKKKLWKLEKLEKNNVKQKNQHKDKN